MAWFTFPSPEELASSPAPNFVNPVTKRSLLLGIEIPLLCLVVLFNAVRFYRYVFDIVVIGVCAKYVQ